jgi:hypothetical protein
MSNVSGLRRVAAEVFERYGQQYGDGNCHARNRQLMTAVLVVYSESPASACHATSHNNKHNLSHIVPDYTQRSYLVNPKNV